MRLYWESFEAEPGASVDITGPDHHHVARVMRRKVGDVLHFFCAEKGEWEARITNINKHAVTCHISQQVRQPLVPLPAVHLAVARLKPDAWGWMLEKATELGATHIQPLITDRVQGGSSWQPHKWHMLMKGAAQQCERLDVPHMLPLLSLIEFIHHLDASITWFVAMERCGAGLLAQSHLGDVGIIIGPEGGFSEAEKRLILACQHIKPVTLGSNILRAETATLCALTLLRHNH